MRATFSRLPGLLPLLLALAGGTAFGEPAGNYAPPGPSFMDGNVPLPLFSTNPEQGGFFAAANFVMIRESNPLGNQVIAYRGFVDVDGSITGHGGSFVGSQAVALTSKDVSGPGTYQPGFKIDLGWRFPGEMEASTITFSWMYFTEAKYNAQASLAAPFLQEGQNLANSFLFSPVYAFPSEYSGPPSKVGVGDPGATFGIWNAASVETIQFIQKLQQWDITYRLPFYSNENYRISGLMGGRFLWIWEQFQWKTFDLDAAGNNGPLDTAIYNNIVSNRMYGPSIGCSQEWYVGHGFACNLDLGTAALLDIVKERINYTFADRDAAPQSKLGRTDYTIAFQFTANAGVTWYPIEGVTLKAGYDLWFLLNSLAAVDPINFNWGSPAYQYDHVWRTFDGFTASVAIAF